MEKFWVFLDRRMQGPLDIAALLKLPGFHPETKVCRDGDEAWQPASEDLRLRDAMLERYRGFHTEATWDPSFRQLPQWRQRYLQILKRSDFSSELTRPVSQVPALAVLMIGFIFLNGAIYWRLFQMVRHVNLALPIVSMHESKVTRPSLHPRPVLHKSHRP